MTWKGGRTIKKEYKVNDRAYRMVVAARGVIKDSKDILDDGDIEVVKVERAILDLKIAMRMDHLKEITTKTNKLADDARDLDNKIRRSTVIVNEDMTYGTECPEKF
ncbi:MAG: hypothetical protein SCARUB_01322 [Candidatus Scalindua rubra]|uniref:Uncharacterized protein n=1 Tax=Candidatus Scalindua rubra TaxID=1872076 RepID=A0A1E3XD33_9BACT|nr:MAG: hypothetical protein SCARUB_01322 [Candidatus Scalindua rubra]